MSIAPGLPGKSDEIISVHRDSVAKACKGQKGFMGLYLLRNCKTGKGITITSCDTGEDMPAGARALRGLRLRVGETEGGQRTPRSPSFFSARARVR